jgi:hypothetical protein
MEGTAHGRLIDPDDAKKVARAIGGVFSLVFVFVGR